MPAHACGKLAIASHPHGTPQPSAQASEHTAAYAVPAYALGAPVRPSPAYLSSPTAAPSTSRMLSGRESVGELKAVIGALTGMGASEQQLWCEGEAERKPAEWKDLFKEATNIAFMVAYRPPPTHDARLHPTHPRSSAKQRLEPRP